MKHQVTHCSQQSNMPAHEDMTQRELIIRMDERLKQLQEDVGKLTMTLLSKVNDDQSYKDTVTKVNKMWDDRNKLVGYIAAASLGFSILVKLIEKYWLNL